MGSSRYWMTLVQSMAKKDLKLWRSFFSERREDHRKIGFSTCHKARSSQFLRSVIVYFKSPGVWHWSIIC
jgi:hypothetical protein